MHKLGSTRYPHSDGYHAYTVPGSHSRPVDAWHGGIRAISRRLPAQGHRFRLVPRWSANGHLELPKCRRRHRGAVDRICSSVTPPAFGEFEMTVGAPSWNQSETMPLCRKTPRNGTDTTVPGINRAGVTSWNCVGMITVTMWIPGTTQFMHI